MGIKDSIKTGISRMYKNFKEEMQYKADKDHEIRQASKEAFYEEKKIQSVKAAKEKAKDLFKKKENSGSLFNPVIFNSPKAEDFKMGKITLGMKKDEGGTNGTTAEGKEKEDDKSRIQA